MTKSTGISMNLASRSASARSSKVAKEENATREEATLSYNVVQKS